MVRLQIKAIPPVRPEYDSPQSMGTVYRLDGLVTILLQSILCNSAMGRVSPFRAPGVVSVGSSGFDEVCPTPT